MNKLKLVIIILSLLTLNFTASGKNSKYEYLVDRETIIPHIWPNEQKVSIEKKRQTEIDYIAKSKIIDPEQEWLIGLTFVRRLNINALDKLSKQEVDYKYAARSSHGTSYKEHALDAQVIILGIIVEITTLNKDEYFYNVIYKVKIDSLICGKNYLQPKKEYLFVQGKPTFPLQLKKGEKGLLFLTRVYWNDFDPNNKLLNNQKTHDITYEKDTFLPVTFSTIRIKKDGSIENTDHDAGYLPLAFDKKTGKTKVGISLEEVIKEVKEIYETNDTYNFFNREYK